MTSRCEAIATRAAARRSDAHALRVLFLGHDASQTGAPILLLQLLRWLRKHTSIEAKAILGADGPLLEEFSSVAETVILDDEWERSRDDPLWMNLPKARSIYGSLSRRRIRSFVAGFRPDLLYSNTVATARILRSLEPIDIPKVVHLHELGMLVKTYVGEENAAAVVRNATAVVTVSEAVSDYARKHFGISDDRIHLVREYLPMSAVDVNPLARAELRRQLDIPENAFVAGSIGTPDWRKGVDLQVQLALQVGKRNEGLPIYFVWLGGRENCHALLQLQHDAERAGVGHLVRYTSAKPNPLEYMSAFDVFVLLSREDPYPLVVLEAAFLEKPIVCFAGAGGAPEFVEHDCGVVVPYLDIPAMAECLVHLGAVREFRERLGRAARQKVVARHDIAIAAPQLVEVMRMASESCNSVTR